MKNFAGVDYGSKVAGTTVIARLKKGEIVLSQSEKGKDADSFLKEIITAEKIEFLTLDAPLSLPGKLVGVEGSDNYFYRTCDRQLKAMSPMFIGGLTARAMKLRDELKEMGVLTREAYPKAFVDQLNYKQSYQKKNLATLQKFTQELTKEQKGYKLPDCNNWHQVDAIIAFLIALKYQNNTHQESGNPEEGTIIF